MFEKKKEKKFKNSNITALGDRLTAVRISKPDFMERPRKYISGN